MKRVGLMQDYELMLDACAQAGGIPEVLKDSNVAHLVVHEDKVIGSHLVDGLILEPVETESRVRVRLIVKKGVRIARPVHLCFGVMPEEGVQEILMHVELQDGAGLELLAHCVFPNAVKVIHRMAAEIVVGNDASDACNEVHFHGENGGTGVIPRARIRMGNNNRLVTHELAKVTHEAAIGRVDQKLVETLMARGLDEERAIDLVIGGMLK